MKVTLYNVVFKGEIIGGGNVEDVKKNISARFKMDPKTVHRLFTAQWVIIKRNVDYKTALKFQILFERAGAICHIEAIEKETEEEFTNLHQRYNVVFEGKIAEGQAIEKVKKNLSSFLKLSKNRIEKLFAGHPVIFMEDLEYRPALKIQTMFELAGAVCEIIPVSSQLAQAIQEKTAFEEAQDLHESHISEEKYEKEEHEEIEITMWQFYAVASVICALLISLSGILHERLSSFPFLHLQGWLSILDISMAFLLGFFLALFACFIAYPWFPIVSSMWRTSLVYRLVIMSSGILLLALRWLSQHQISISRHVMNVDSYIFIVSCTSIILGFFSLSCLVHFLSFLVKIPILRVLNPRKFDVALKLLKTVSLILLFAVVVYMVLGYSIDFWYAKHPPSTSEIEAILRQNITEEEYLQKAKLAEKGCDVENDSGIEIINVQNVKASDEFKNLPGKSKHLITLWNTGICVRGKKFEIATEHLLVRNPPEFLPRDKTGRWGIMPIWRENDKYLRITTSGTEKITVHCIDSTDFDPGIHMAKSVDDNFSSANLAQCKNMCLPSAKCDIQDYLEDGWRVVTTSSPPYKREMTSGSITCYCYTRTYKIERE